MQAEFDIYQIFETEISEDLKSLFTAEENVPPICWKWGEKVHVHISIQRWNIYKVAKSQMFVYIEHSCVEYMVHCWRFAHRESRY